MTQAPDPTREELEQRLGDLEARLAAAQEAAFTYRDLLKEEAEALRRAQNASQERTDAADRARRAHDQLRDALLELGASHLILSFNPATNLATIATMSRGALDPIKMSRVQITTARVVDGALPTTAELQ